MDSSSVDVVNVTLPKFINKKKVTKVLTKVVKTQSKTSKEMNHQDVIHDNKEYTVCYTPYVDKHILFVIDRNDKDKVITKTWHKSSTDYLCTHVKDDTRLLALHNFVMNKLTFEGKGQHHTIDHINRIGRDNRKENLRLITASAQNANQCKIARKIELPSDCDIRPDDIPKHVYYVKAHGLHGDGFSVEIRGVHELNNGLYKWKTSRSKAASLKVKLQHAINKLQELQEKYPVLQNVIKINESDEQHRMDLTKGFNDIIKATTYPEVVIQQNLVEFKSECIQQVKLNDEEDSHLQGIAVMNNAGKKTLTKLPVDCGVTIDMIPKYCYYRAANSMHGDGFVIERHPLLLKRCWTTTKLISVSTKDKFDSLMAKLKELEA
jgi:hypothetical protein